MLALQIATHPFVASTFRSHIAKEVATKLRLLSDQSLIFITTGMTSKGRGALKDQTHPFHHIRSLEKKPSDMLGEFEMLEIEAAESGGWVTVSASIEPPVAEERRGGETSIVDTIATEMEG